VENQQIFSDVFKKPTASPVAHPENGNFFGKVRPVFRKEKWQHNTHFPALSGEIYSLVCTGLQGRQISKTPEYLLKTITFPHSPQVFPQGFSTDPPACGYAFQLT